MTDFLINDKIFAKGEMTVQQQAINEQIQVSGIMELDIYIDDIDTIATEIFYIAGVTIIKESFGTSDKKVVYEFIGKGFGIDKDLFNSKSKGE